MNDEEDGFVLKGTLIKTMTNFCSRFRFFFFFFGFWDSFFLLSEIPRSIYAYYALSISLLASLTRDHKPSRSLHALSLSILCSAFRFRERSGAERRERERGQ